MTSFTSTIDGNLTADPELRYTPNGTPVANFTVAHTPRSFNEEKKEWQDAGETVFVRVTAWRNLAENCANSLRKGNNVIASGPTSLETYEARDGSNRASIKLTADSVSVPLNRQTVLDVTRSSGNSGNSNGGGYRSQGGQSQSQNRSQGSTPATSGGFSDEPPF